MRVVLVRHPVPLIEAGVCYGRLDVGAEDAAPPLVFEGAAGVWTSPARRCRGYARAIAGALAVPLIVDERLQELDFGAWEGQRWDAIARADLDRWAASPLTFAPPGGESGAELIVRVRGFLAAMRRDCVVVSHGGPLKVLAALLLGEKVDLLAAAPAFGSVRIFTDSLG